MSVTDEFKICPFCREQIRAAAVKCRFCGEWLEQLPPQLSPPPVPLVPTPGKKSASADGVKGDYQPVALPEPSQPNQESTNHTEKTPAKASEQVEKAPDCPPPETELTESRSRTFGSVPNVNVELQGPEHDRLIVSSPTMNATIASNLPVLLRTADADFWNRTKFLGFSEFVFSGSNYYESITAEKMAQWGTGYDTFVSNMVAMYDTGFSQGQSPTSGSGEVRFCS